jgi:hypothetical protein
MRYELYLQDGMLLGKNSDYMDEAVVRQLLAIYYNLQELLSLKLFESCFKDHFSLHPHHYFIGRK